MIRATGCDGEANDADSHGIRAISRHNRAILVARIAAAAGICSRIASC